MNNKWIGGVRRTLFGNVKAIETKHGWLSVKGAMHDIWNELYELRRQTKADKVLIAGIGAEMEEKQKEARELEREIGVLKRRVEFMRLEATSQPVPVPLSSAEMLRNIQEARASIISDRQYTPSRMLSETMVRLSPLGGPIPFGERGTETVVPRPPASEFSLKRVPDACVEMTEADLEMYAQIEDFEWRAGMGSRAVATYFDSVDRELKTTAKIRDEMLNNPASRIVEDDK